MSEEKVIFLFWEILVYRKPNGISHSAKWSKYDQIAWLNIGEGSQQIKAENHS